MFKKACVIILMATMASMPNLQLNAELSPVQLQVRIDDPEENQPPVPRTPVLIPEVSIEDYTLYFDTPCDGCVLRVVNELGVAEYTTVIPVDADELVLPSYLSGDYELQIIRDNWCFYGDITL